MYSKTLKWPSSLLCFKIIQPLVFNRNPSLFYNYTLENVYTSYFNNRRVLHLNHIAEEMRGRGVYTQYIIVIYCSWILAKEANRRTRFTYKKKLYLSPTFLFFNSTYDEYYSTNSFLKLFKSIKMFVCSNCLVLSVF